MRGREGSAFGQVADVANRPIADLRGPPLSRGMRAIPILLILATLATGCSDGGARTRQTMSHEEFAQTFTWSRVPENGWASSPTLVIAKRDGLYPEAPDVEIQLTCLRNGSLSVSGRMYEVTTDVNGPPDTTARFSLRSSSLSLSGEPVWENGSFSKAAHLTLRPTAGQLSDLVNGEWFEVVSIFADGSGTMRYPAPPKELAAPFLKDCGDLRDVR